MAESDNWGQVLCGQPEGINWFFYCCDKRRDEGNLQEVGLAWSLWFQNGNSPSLSQQGCVVAGKRDNWGCKPRLKAHISNSKQAAVCTPNSAHLGKPQSPPPGTYFLSKTTPPQTPQIATN